MWNSDFGSTFGGGGAAGGGFLNSQNFTSPGSSSQSKDRKSLKGSTNVIPFTTSQIRALADDKGSLFVGSVKAQMLTIVGIVCSVDEQPTRIVYQIDDFTGPPLEVEYWIADDDVPSDVRSQIIENTYVRVVGASRMIQNKHFIMAFKLMPILDMNELTVHLLEVAHVRMSIAAMDKEGVSMETGTAMGGDRQPFGTEQMDTAPSFGGGGFGNAAYGLNKTQQMILRCIASSTNEEGISFNDICKSLTSLSRNTIKDTLDFLTNEGHVYTSIDDNHYKATDGD